MSGRLKVHSRTIANPKHDNLPECKCLPRRWCTPQLTESRGRNSRLRYGNDFIVSGDPASRTALGGGFSELLPVDPPNAGLECLQFRTHREAVPFNPLVRLPAGSADYTIVGQHCGGALFDFCRTLGAVGRVSP